jgi:hypothetical protein
LSDKNFKVKNKLVIAGLTNASGVLLAEGHTVDSHTNLATQYGGTGTTTSPNSGQLLYSSSGSTYAPTDLSSIVTPVSYSADAPSSPVTGQIWVESDSSATAFDTNIISRQAYTATAAQTVFTTTQPFIEGHEQVYFNGMLILRGTDYTTSGSNTVTLASGAAASDIVEILTVTNLSTYIATPYSTLNSDTSLVVNKRYYVSSSSTALTLTLPGSPAVNDQIDIFDASGNAATYNITVARNTKKINGVTGNLIIDTNGAWMTLIYTGAAYGWKAA